MEEVQTQKKKSSVFKAICTVCVIAITICAIIITASTLANNAQTARQMELQTQYQQQISTSQKQSSEITLIKTEYMAEVTFNDPTRSNAYSTLAQSDRGVKVKYYSNGMIYISGNTLNGTTRASGYTFYLPLSNVIYMK